MIRKRVQPVPLLVLTVTWVLLWGNLTAANVLGGLVLGAIVLLMFPLPRLVTGVRVRPWPLLVLLAVFNRDLMVASAQVAWQAIAHGPRTRGVLISVPLRSPDELMQTLTAEMVALVPGTVVVDLDTNAQQLLVHALDITDEAGADRVCRSIHAQEDRVLRALASDPTCGQGGRS